MKYFVAVAEMKTIAGAAKRLSMSASPLSRRIRDLEEYMGSPLFHRTRSDFTLTTIGRQLLPIARSTLNAAAEIEHLRGSQLTPGLVRVGLTPGFPSSLSQSLLETLNLTHPACAIHFQTFDSATAQDHVLNHKLDFATVRQTDEDSQLSRLGLVREMPVLIMCDHNAAMKPPPLTRGSLEGWTGIFSHHPTLISSIMQFLSNQRVSNLRVIPGANTQEIANALQAPRTFTVALAQEAIDNLQIIETDPAIIVETSLIWRSDRRDLLSFVNQLRLKLDN